MSGRDKEPTLTLCEAVACLAVPCNPVGVKPDINKHHILKLEHPTPENIQDWYGNIITAMKKRAEGGKMIKVTSADCKACIVEDCYPESKTSDWKRRSKRKEDDVVVRLFQNDAIGKAVEVLEKDGEIVGSRDAEAVAGKSKAEFLYSVFDSEDDPGMFELCFTTVQEWETRGCQSDTGIDEVGEVMSKLGIYEDAENFYLVEGSQIELVKEVLQEDKRFEMRKAFSDFIERCDG